MRHSIESTLHSFIKTLSRALISEKISTYPGILQSLDPRARLIGMFLLLLAVVLSHSYTSLLILMAVTLVLAIVSGIGLSFLAKRVWLVAFLFTGIIALPALVLTPGTPIVTTFPGNIPITEAGLRTAILLVLRVETAVTITAVLVLCTPWNKLLRATRALGMPAELVTILSMTHRYIFLCLETAGQMFESRKSRTIGKLESSEQRAMAAKTAAVLLMKSVDLSEDVYSAMLARGFSGEVRLIEESRMRPKDFWALAAFAVVACFCFWMGR